MFKYQPSNTNKNYKNVKFIFFNSFFEFFDKYFGGFIGQVGIPWEVVSSLDAQYLHNYIVKFGGHNYKSHIWRHIGHIFWRCVLFWQIVFNKMEVICFNANQFLLSFKHKNTIKKLKLVLPSSFNLRVINFFLKACFGGGFSKIEDFA